MNTRKLFFGLLACVAMLAVSCTPNSSADDQLYEQESIDRTKIKVPTHGIDRTKIKVPTHGIDRTKIKVPTHG